MTAAIGTLSQLGIDTSNPVTARFDFVSENLVLQSTPIDASGVRGTRKHFIDRVRGNIHRIQGPIVMQPNAVEMALLLPWIMCGTPSGSGTVTYPLGDTLTTRYVTVDRISKVFTYAGVGVDVATFNCSTGQPLSLELQCVGQTETIANSGTFPGLTIDATNGPWVMSDLSLSVNGVSSVTCPSFRLSVNNAINKDRFFNSLTLTETDAWDRSIDFSTVVPYGDWQQLNGLGTAGAGVAVTATFTNGSAVLTFTLPKVVFQGHSPAVPGRAEIMLPLNGIAYSVSGGSDELSISENPGP